MNLILALDTTHEFGSVALLRDGEIIDEILLHAPEGFGQVLFGHLEKLLERSGVAVRDIACFAAACGPGSFTGVRVGLACVKGLAEAEGKPVVAVSNLGAVASFGRMPMRAAVLDARRGEIYGAVYGAAGETIQAERVTKLPAWIAGLPQTGELEFLSTDFEPFRAALSGTRFAEAPVTTVPRALAAAVGKIAWRRLRAGEALDAAAADANYVRRSDAELFWKEY